MFIVWPPFQHCWSNISFVFTNCNSLQHFTAQQHFLATRRSCLCISNNIGQQCFWTWPNCQTFVAKQILNVGPTMFDRLARTLLYNVLLFARACPQGYYCDDSIASYENYEMTILLQWNNQLLQLLEFNLFKQCLNPSFFSSINIC